MHQLIGTGIYPLNQAARLVGESSRYVRRWLRGYSWKYKDGRSRSGPLWHTQFEREQLPGGMVIGFRDLLELRLVAEFVRHGVHLKVIRATIEAAERHFGQSYPLSNRQFLTDGKRIFLQAVEQATGTQKLIDVVGRQFVFSEVIRPSLYAGIEYDDGEAKRWYPVKRSKAIVLDPEIQFGAPMLSEAGIPTDAIFDAWKAEGEDKGRVARLYDVTPAMVSAAVTFEQRLAA
ncbi:MAG: hypothetical protein JWP65_3935 [Ramlibacter sp.]|uniref:DUF433 domain-containing protein n=1 Tax=Ramlibacter sp. TaxID=1917967 RepID=UPI002617E6FA|nr:DUF433 domain-containing protein [Ramlibacter sp.]MDB5753514.1 hypothetical protein [Ramlibacter sp.]